MGMRRKSRELALQTLYSLSFEPVDDYLGMLSIIDKTSPRLLEIADREDIDSESPIFEFAGNILLNTVKNIISIDDEIKNHTKNWSFDRIAALDKNLLRIAAYEIIYTETPVPIVIDEAVEISKKYCSEKSGKFINGILNAIGKDCEKK
ncbi:MAG: transcription antitermination factor NusB [Candidatus Cloacimonadota bacterium]|nr:MAG: transcription antitermination factor NusB [Candidatus Cloacimonadota bacterium]